jgi:hypothetical protein
MSEPRQSLEDLRSRNNVSSKSFNSPAWREVWLRFFSSVFLQSNVVIIRMNCLLQSLDPIYKKESDDASCEIPENFTNGLTNILYLNGRSSFGFAFQPTEEEWSDVLPVGRMRDSLESKLGHLLPIGLEIVSLALSRSIKVNDSPFARHYDENMPASRIRTS